MHHSALVFDTLDFANKLKAAGVPDRQAEVQAEAIAGIITENLATKQDLREMELRITTKLGGIMVGGISLLVILMKLFHL